MTPEGSVKDTESMNCDEQSIHTKEYKVWDKNMLDH